MIAPDLDSQLLAAKAAIDEIARLIDNANENSKELEDSVAALGLFPSEEWSLKHFPPSLHQHCGKGLGLWQYPKQLAPLLVLLHKYHISAYLEIGVAAGGTFMLMSELLQRWCKDDSFRSVACDPAPPGCINYSLDKRYQALFNAWLQASPFADYLQEYSERLERKCWPDPEQRPSFDCVFVDGDHSFEGCWDDVQMAIRLNASIIILHDIVSAECPGVCEAWSKCCTELAEDFDFHEFTGQYESVRDVLDQTLLGIGVCVRKSLAFRND